MLCRWVSGGLVTQCHIQDMNPQKHTCENLKFRGDKLILSFNNYRVLAHIHCL